MLFQSYSRSIEGSYLETETLLWCLDTKSEPCLLRLEGLTYDLVLEIPTKWLLDKINIENKLQLLLTHARVKPVFQKLEVKFKLYYYQEKQTPFIRFSFDKKSDVYTFRKAAQEAKMNVYEENVCPIRKLFTNKHIEYSQWFEADCTEINDSEKISHVKEYICDCNDIKPSDHKQETNPVILSYDIEVYSNIHNVFPNANVILCPVYMISLVYRKINTNDTIFELLTTLQPNEVKVDNITAKIRYYESEQDLLCSFLSAIKRINPVILTGYNLNFDNEYLIRRFTTLSIKNKLFNPSCLRNCVQPIFQSSDEKRFINKTNTNFFTIPGRITIDMLPYLKKMYPTMTKHTLDYVSEQLLGDKKHDVTPKQMFEIYNKYFTLLLKQSFSKLNRDEQQEFIDNQYPDIQDMLNNNSNFSEKEIADIRGEYTRVSAYCIKDSVLPIALMEKENAWIGQKELSNIMGVDIETLLTEAEQSKCYSQIYDACYNNKTVLSTRINNPMSSEGGYVTDPIKGLHEKVHLVDFESLYPVIIIWMNICYTTLYEAGSNNKITEDKLNKISYSQSEIVVPKGDKKPSKNTKAAKEATKVINYERNFVKKEVKEGILPKLMDRMRNERKAVRKLRKTLIADGDPKHKLEIERLEARQLAIKIAANSIYGFLKVNKGGKLPFPEGAQAITAVGRQSIKKTAEILENKGGIITYGDTDSCFVKFSEETIESLTGKPYSMDNELKYVEDVCKEISNHFGKPMNLEHEQSFWRILHLCKKKYCGIKYDPTTKSPKVKDDGSYDMYIKGMVPQKRENSPILKRLYVDVLKMLMLKASPYNVIQMLWKTTLDMINNKIPKEDFYMIKKYTGNFKTNCMMKTFGDCLSSRGMTPADGGMLEYAICMIDEQTECLKNKYKRNKDLKTAEAFRTVDEFKQTNFEIDYLTYIDKFSNQIDQLFEVVHGHNEILQRVEIKKSKTSKPIYFTSPMKLISTMLYETEEQMHKVNSDKQWFIKTVTNRMEKYFESIEELNIEDDNHDITIDIASDSDDEE